MTAASGASSPSESAAAAVPTDGAPSPDDAAFLSAPGWYTIDYRRNVQAFWDGAMWSRTRHWRGVGWFEDEVENWKASRPRAA